MKIHETSKILTVSDFPSLPEGPIRTLEMSWKKRITTIHLINVTRIQVALAHQSATHEFLPCPTSQMLVLPGFESTNNSPAEPSKHLHSHHLHSPLANRLKQWALPVLHQLIFAWCWISFHFWHSKNLPFSDSTFFSELSGLVLSALKSRHGELQPFFESRAAVS